MSNKSILSTLDNKTKFWYIFLCVITLGIFYFYVKSKIKSANNKSNVETVDEPKKEPETAQTTSKSKNNDKINKNNTNTKSTNTKANTKTTSTKKVITNNENVLKKLKTSNKINFDINDLISALGGLENIIDLEASLNSLKVAIKNKANVNQESIKKLGAKGIMLSSNKVSIIFGDNSLAICEAIKLVKKDK